MSNITNHRKTIAVEAHCIDVTLDYLSSLHTDDLPICVNFTDECHEQWLSLSAATDLHKALGKLIKEAKDHA